MDILKKNKFVRCDINECTILCDNPEELAKHIIASHPIEFKIFWKKLCKKNLLFRPLKYVGEKTKQKVLVRLLNEGIKQNKIGEKNGEI